MLATGERPPGLLATGGRPPGTPLEREGLRAPVHFGAAVLDDRVDRRAGQRVVGREQPAERLQLVEAAVEEQGQRSAQALDDLMAVQEGGWYRNHPFGTGHGEELTVAQQLLHSPGRNAELAGYIEE